MRYAGQKLKPHVNTGQGCAKKPESYPPKPRGGYSHGPALDRAANLKRIK